ncbi:MAG: ferrochelatase [Planctomycetes bacterium]|nr:ferrochelatase [Planctomycetota bacterium]
MTADPRRALLVLDPGGPARAEEVEDYLVERFLDEQAWPLPPWRAPFRGLLARRRARRLAPAWRRDIDRVAIDSPHERVARAQAHGIAERLGREGYVAARHGRPGIAETLGLMRAEGVEGVDLLLLDPTDGRPTAVQAEPVRRRWIAAGGAAEALAVVGGFLDDPGVIAVWSAQLGETLALVRDRSGPVLFLGAGSAPALERLGRALVAAHGLDGRARFLALADRAAPPTAAGGPEAIIEELAAAGARHLVVVPLGWVADRHETLYDVDLMLARRARELGMRTYRVPTLNDRPEFLDALAHLVGKTTAMARPGERDG